MASSTEPVTLPPEDTEVDAEQRELEPLLGRPGDAAQPTGGTVFRNLVLGTGVLAQFGVFILVALIWASVFLNPLILFSGHPLAQSLVVLTLTQSILVLQPTHTAEQKKVGQLVHASLNVFAILVLIAGVFIIEYNKFVNNGVHFHSVHGYLGVITASLLLLQYLFGVSMWAVPWILGGEEKARHLWKYHRWSGYLLLTLLLATVSSATQTDYNIDVLKIKLWAVLLLSVLILVGILPRVQKQKLGF